MAFFVANDSKWIFWVVLGALIVIAGIILWRIIAVSVRSKRAKAERLRLAIEQEVQTRVEERVLEMRNEFFVLPRNVIIAVGLEGQIREGRYILQSSVSSQTKFNIRVNGLVEEYSNGDTVFLTTDDTICAVSGSVLIKPDIQ